MLRRTLTHGGGLLLVAALVSGCDGSPSARTRPVAPPTTAPTPTPTTRTRSPTTTPAPTPTPTAPSATATRPPYQVSDGRPRLARVSVPALGLRDLRVVPYRGRTDDAPGTRIQDRGHAASPFGPRGGAGPGGVGNYQVTAHRTSSTQAFARLPELRRGDRVVVTAGGVDYVYRVVGTRETSFRSARSLREQRAAVPGRPGAVPTRAMITLSTCATQEDHAAGNYWADRFDNPEHRIDKIGVLVATRPAA
jgi:sortase A